MEENETQNVEGLKPEETSFKSSFCTVTPFSKYLAMVLFVALPFLGFWAGWTLNDEDVVVNNSVLNGEVVQENNSQNTTVGTVQEEIILSEGGIIDTYEILENEEFILYYKSDYWSLVSEYDKGEYLEGKLLLLKGQTLQGETEIFASGPYIRVTNSSSERINLIRAEYEEIYEMTEVDGYLFEEIELDGEKIVRIMYPALSWGGNIVEYFYTKSDGTMLSISHYPYEISSTSTKEFLEVLDTLILK